MFYITISNGLLEDDHQIKMGAAVWQYMWLIDKVTRIDEDGWGWVLGGKPINLDDLAGSVTRDTVSRNLRKLAAEGYIEVTHAPYGLIIRVSKAKKRFGRNVERGSTKMSKGGGINVEPNIDKAVDSNSKTLPKGRAKTPGPNPIISSLFQELRELNSGMLDGSEKDNRRYCWLILQKFKYRESPESAAKLTRALMAAAKADGFHRRNATGFKYLYYNAARIIQTAQSQKSKIHIIPA